MRLYWIAYHYSDGLDLEMLDGPYGTRSEAESERESMMELFLDENLVIVRETRDVELA
jgi:hypothetical protein